MKHTSMPSLTNVYPNIYQNQHHLLKGRWGIISRLNQSPARLIVSYPNRLNNLSSVILVSNFTLLCADYHHPSNMAEEDLQPIVLDNGEYQSDHIHKPY